MKKILFASILLLLTTTSTSYAGPALDDSLDILQPDGTSFKARKHGDEFQNWTETESGHTVIRNKKSREWEYATQNPDGTLRGSGQKVIPGQKAPSSIPIKLRPPRNTDAEKAHSQSLQEIYQQRIPGASTTPTSQSSDITSYAVGDWTPLPISGTRKIIVIMVNFSDRSLTTSASGWNSAVFSTAAGVKSVANYYKDNSLNTLFVTPVSHSQAGNPSGVVTVSVPYVHPDNGTVESTWVAAAINAANAYVSFAALDTDGNGYIDREEAVVYLIPAGYEESGSAIHPSVWAHATRYTSGGLNAAGKYFPVYAMNGELNDYSVQHPIGVIAHEMGHQFCGLPDLYDTSSINSGMGLFSLMAGGSWGQDTGEYSGATPTNLDAWSREYLGWATPITPASSSTLSLGQPLSSLSAVYKLIAPTVSASEYFLVENRQPVGWDRGLRGKTGFGSSWAGGLLLTHIDITAGTVGLNDINKYTANGGRQGVIPVQASTSACNMLVGTACRGYATTLFYSGNNASWSPSTTPNSNFYSGSTSNFSLLGISSQATTMTASISFIPPTIIQLPVAIDNDNWTLTTGGSGSWSGQDITTHDGVDAAQSATITDDQITWMQTTLNEPGTLSFWWKVSSESEYDFLTFYVDNVEQTGAAARISGEVDWKQVSGIAIPAGSHTIKWQYSKDGSESTGSDAGWVDQMVFTPSVPPVTIQLPVAIDNDSWTLTTGGSGNWSGQNTTTRDGVDAAQSATITHSQSTWMQTTLNEPGSLSFWWKVSSESGFDFLTLYVDNVEQTGAAVRISGEVDWKQVSGIVIPAGSHTIKWQYSKDGSMSTGSDAGWVDQVVFTPLFSTLTFTIDGTGGGSVNSVPSGIACAGTAGSSCPPQSFSTGSTVTLSASADSSSSNYSIFTGWTPACNGTGPCSVTMNGSKNVAANFIRDRFVKHSTQGSGTYGTILEALGSASAGQIIQVRDNSGLTPFVDALTITKNVFLKGGFDSGFATNTGYTTSNGKLTIGNGGVLRVERIIIKQPD